MRIKKLPTILALHLKRFKYMEQYNRHIKVSHRVVFPLELRLFNTVSQPHFKVIDIKYIHTFLWAEAENKLLQFYLRYSTFKIIKISSPRLICQR